jgi:hypothetical protein
MDPPKGERKINKIQVMSTKCLRNTEERRRKERTVVEEIGIQNLLTDS